MTLGFHYMKGILHIEKINETKGNKTMVINIKTEVESLLGHLMTPQEYKRFRLLRKCGFANSHDIVRELLK